jgi:hypothetical protein
MNSPMSEMGGKLQLKSYLLDFGGFRYKRTLVFGSQLDAGSF